VDGDGCFAVSWGVWQSRLVGRHVLGGIPDERAAAASLRPLLQGRFVEQTPGGFEWAALSVRFPDLQPNAGNAPGRHRRLRQLIPPPAGLPVPRIAQ